MFSKAPSTSKNICINYIAIIAQQLPPTGWEETKLVYVKSKTLLLGEEPAVCAADAGVRHRNREQCPPLRRWTQPVYTNYQNDL